MNKYEKGKIYKIVNDDMPDKVYYGSTIRKLNHRFCGHNKSYNYCMSKILFEKGEPRIELVEDYPCSSKIELEKRERWYIENNECINRKIPGRTQKEWNDANKEWKSNWYLENRERRLIENGKKYLKNKEEIKAKNSEYYHNNKDLISEKRKIRITCECGSTFRKTDKIQHEKSIKHKNFISSLGH